MRMCLCRAVSVRSLCITRVCGGSAESTREDGGHAGRAVACGLFALSPGVALFVTARIARWTLPHLDVHGSR